MRVIRLQSGVIQNNLTRFPPNLAIFLQTITYCDVMCHFELYVSYMVGNLLKMQIFWCNGILVIYYHVGSGTFVFMRSRN